MESYIAFLRAVNVGGTGKMPMADLKVICQELGFDRVQTYLASGNVVFRSGLSEGEIKTVLNARLQAYAGKPVNTLIRTAIEISDVLRRNPFAGEAGNRTVALFVDEPLARNVLENVIGRKDERMILGVREIFIFYGEGMADSRLRIPGAEGGTARNMNTVAALAKMASAP